MVLTAKPEVRSQKLGPRSGAEAKSLAIGIFTSQETKLAN